MSDDLRRLNQISLSHGQAMWVVEAMQIAAWLDAGGLNATLKKFRRHFVPFTQEELRKPRWEAVQYRFEHLLEVVVALKMSGDGMAFRHVVSLLTRDREKLRLIYRRAFLEAESGLGAPLEIRCPDDRRTPRSIHIRGLYLDFSAVARVNGMLASMSPRALDPWEALLRYMGFFSGVHMFPLICISQLATEAVRLAEGAPEVRRGPKG
jgi:hypothetical protein